MIGGGDKRQISYAPWYDVDTNLGHGTFKNLGLVDLAFCRSATRALLVRKTERRRIEQQLAILPKDQATLTRG